MSHFKFKYFKQNILKNKSLMEEEKDELKFLKIFSKLSEN